MSRSLLSFPSGVVLHSNTRSSWVGETLKNLGGPGEPSGALREGTKSLSTEAPVALGSSLGALGSEANLGSPGEPLGALGEKSKSSRTESQATIGGSLGALEGRVKTGVPREPLGALGALGSSGATGALGSMRIPGDPWGPPGALREELKP